MICADVNFLEKIVELFPGHVCWKDVNGVFLGCNKSFLDTLGYKSEDELIGKTDYHLLSKKLADEIHKNDLQVVKAKKTIEFKEVAIDALGNQAIYLSKKVPYFDDKGEVKGIIVIASNITEDLKIQSKLDYLQKQRQQEYRNYLEYFEEQRFVFTGQKDSKSKSLEEYIKDIIDYYNNIIGLLPGNVYWKDKNGYYRGCNINMANILSLGDPKNIVGKTDYDLLDEKLADIATSADNHVMKCDQEYLLEEVGFNVNKQQAIYLTRKVPLHDDRNHVIGLLGVSFDITDRKRIEEDLRKAKQQAEIANKLKTEFIVNMEHDLRTPTGGIYGLSSAIKKKVKDPEIREYISLIMDSSRELLQLLNDVLKVHQIEFGILPVLNKKFNLKKLIGDVIKLEKTSVKEKNIQLLLDYENTIPQYFIGDRFRIHRILINLVGNAVKFTQKGHIKITVKLKQASEKDKVMLLLQVSDTGMGIPEEKQMIIFERFTKLSLSRSNRVKGLGMGLYIVKKFVEELSGSVRVDSKINSGTTFTCSIPLVLCAIDRNKSFG